MLHAFLFSLMGGILEDTIFFSLCRRQSYSGNRPHNKSIWWAHQQPLLQQ